MDKNFNGINVVESLLNDDYIKTSYKSNVNKNYYIYVIHNLLNNKIYVGRTNQPKLRWYRHRSASAGQKSTRGCYVHRAMAKYGLENFTYTVIQRLHLFKECSAAEIYWVKYYQSRNPEFGYNLTDGGEGVVGHIVSEVTKQKMREKATGRKHTVETVLKFSGENSVRSKLKLDDVKNIRYRFNTLNEGIKDISSDYVVSVRSIARVVYNVDWYDENYIPPIPRKINSNGVPKLTLDKANHIRELYVSGKDNSELSIMFGVTKENIAYILSGKTWKNKRSQVDLFVNEKKCEGIRISRNKNPFFKKARKEETKELSRGENNKQSKLTKDKVIEIWNRYYAGERTQQSLADEYGVSRRGIGHILNGRTWKHLSLGVTK